MLEILKFNEKYVIVNYYGLGGQNPKTLGEIGEELELSKERIRQWRWIG